MIPIRRALLSTYDKQGLVAFAERLRGHGIELIATSSTAEALQAAGLPVTPLATRTGIDALFGGRVKTLTPQVHGGLLMRRDDPGDQAAAAAHGIEPIDLLCVNLYPFQETVAQRGDERAACVEMIDIGGPAMIRAAAKNHTDVVVVTAPEQYAAVADALDTHAGAVPRPQAAALATSAFGLTAAYDAAVLDYLLAEDALPAHWAAGGRRWIPLRYGENPHQAAGCYLSGEQFWGRMEQHQGKDLSYNNLADIWAAWQAVLEFAETTCVVVKHRTPSGVAVAADPCRAFERARDGDPLSAFGGVVAVNRPGTEALAEAVGAMFLEVVAAPAWEPSALARLKRKKNLRVLTLPAAAAGRVGRHGHLAIGDGILLQQALPRAAAADAWQVVTQRGADTETRGELAFAWQVVRHVRSNAIAVTGARQSLGLGGGQTSRIDACEIALHKAQRCGHDLRGAVLASDAFFPFRDVVDRAAAAGVVAIVQPGGSRRDAESIAACDEHGLAMYFTGERAFVH